MLIKESLESGSQIMSARGNPYDNAFVESFIRTLKYEEVYLNGYETFQQKEAAFCHRGPLSHRLREGKGDGDGNGKGVKASKVLNTVS